MFLTQMMMITLVDFACLNNEYRVKNKCPNSQEKQLYELKKEKYLCARNKKTFSFELRIDG